MLIKNHRKAYPFLLLFCAISLILSHNINSYSIVLIFVYWLAFTTKQEKKANLTANKHYLLPFLLYFVWNFATIFYSEYTKAIGPDVTGKLALVFLPIAILGNSRLNKLEAKQLKIGYVISLITIVLFAFVKSLILYQKILVNQELSALVGVHASYLSLYISLAFFFVLELFSSTKFKKIWIGLAIFLLITLALLAARMVLLGFLFALIVWFTLKKIDVKALVLIVSSIILSIVFSLFIPEIKTRLVEAVNIKQKVELDTPPNEHRTLGIPYGGRAIRLAIWTCAQDVVKEHWVFGVGIGDAQEALQESYKNHAFEFAWKYNRYNAHNLFLETLIASGVIGLGLVFWLFILLFKLSWNANSLYFFGFVVVFFFISNMETTYNVQRGVVYFALFSSIFIAQYNKKTL